MKPFNLFAFVALGTVLLANPSKAENWVITFNDGGPIVYEVDIDSIRTSKIGMTTFNNRSRQGQIVGEIFEGYAMCSGYNPQVLDMGEWISIREMEENISNKTGIYPIGMWGAPIACKNK